MCFSFLLLSIEEHSFGKEIGEQAAITEPFFRAAESGRFQKQQQRQLHHCGALLPCAKQKCACVCGCRGKCVQQSGEPKTMAAPAYDMSIYHRRTAFFFFLEQQFKRGQRESTADAAAVLTSRSRFLTRHQKKPEKETPRIHREIVAAGSIALFPLFLSFQSCCSSSSTRLELAMAVWWWWCYW